MACSNERPGPNCTVNDQPDLYLAMIIIELFFFATMVLEFFVSYENPKNRFAQIKNIELIAVRYLYGRFINDLIPLIPLQAIPVCIAGHRFE